MTSFRVPPDSDNMGSQFVNLDQVKEFYRIDNVLTFVMQSYEMTVIYENKEEAIEAIRDIHRATSYDN